MSDLHDHDHDHAAETGSPLPEIDLRVRALESLLVEKGLVDPAALDALIDTYETKVGPRNGARVVARAWVDPAYKARLLADGTAAIAELGYMGRQGEDMVVLENTPAVHNERGCFTWKEWAGRLAGELAAAKARGEVDDGSRYYEYWLGALEKLVAAKGLVLETELLTRKDEWDRAARATPHGRPIVLRAGR